MPRPTGLNGYEFATITSIDKQARERPVLTCFKAKPPAVFSQGVCLCPWIIGTSSSCSFTAQEPIRGYCSWTSLCSLFRTPRCWGFPAEQAWPRQSEDDWLSDRQETAWAWMRLDKQAPHPWPSVLAHHRAVNFLLHSIDTINCISKPPLQNPWDLLAQCRSDSFMQPQKFWAQWSEGF